MQVWELIERLERLPEEANVVLSGNDNTLVEQVYLNKSGRVVLEGLEDDGPEEPHD